MTTILEQVRRETHNKYFSMIFDKGDNLLVTCPYHKDGQERHPSCSIFNKDDDPETRKGMLYCFACGQSASIESVIAHCFDEEDNIKFGEEWLLDRFGDVIYEEEEYLPEIELKPEAPMFLPESTLDEYSYFHQYMFQRKLSEDVIRKFRVGYNFSTDSIVFPLRDIKGRLVGTSERSVTGKRFDIKLAYNHPNPVFLLYAVVKEHPTATIVCEAQIDALTAWSYGYAAVAMIGTGSSLQYEILNSCPVRNYVLMFDNDKAGRQAVEKFKRNIRDDVFITEAIVPDPFKDINDTSKEQFDAHLASLGVTNLLKL